ncbi:MAG: sulfite reductase, dissimilatory-type subunit alpha, partial [Rhodomicrobium sp.]
MASDDVMKAAQSGGGQPSKHATPMLDELESGPWPSFVTGLKRLRDNESAPYAPMMNDLLGQLEHSYEERMGFW